MNYDILALDMDGTLLNSKKEISPATFEALREASQKGCRICLSTGRGYRELLDYQKEMEILSYGILLSGGCIYDFRREEVIETHEIEKRLVSIILEAVKDTDVMMEVFTAKEAYLQADQLDHIADYHMEPYLPMYRRLGNLVDDARATAMNPDVKVLKWNLYHKSKEDRERTRRAIEALPLSLADAEGASLEITPAGIDKGAGLRRLAESLQVPMERTAAVGDADNDLSILQAAGLAVAMGNANAHVLAVADLVTDDNDHDGIAKFLRRTDT